MTQDAEFQIKKYIVGLIQEQGIEAAEQKFANLGLDPEAEKARRLFGQLVQGDNGEWYFDERNG